MSQCVGYDFTLKAEGQDLERILAFLREWCKEWVFQLEAGDETGYKHYQGRCRLIKKRRPCELKTKWHDIMPGIHVTPTSGPAFTQKEFCYVMKADTRIEGPWSSNDVQKTMTRRLKEFMDREMYPWQKKIIEMAKVYDDRTVKIILDTIGTRGKSTIAEYMEYHDLAYDLPPMLAMEDIMQACMGIPAQKAYIIDMPKGLRKEKLASFYAGIECLKNGVMYDKRYAFKKRRIDCPQIFVFTNHRPDTNLLSKDRWVGYEITVDYDLLEIEL